MLKQNLMGEEWDFCLVLDACRFDTFQETYDAFLEGKLEKRISLGSTTPEWLRKTFTDFYENVTYFSANPFINSVDMDLNQLDTSHGRKSWYGENHFKEIVNSWLYDWNDELDTVHPQKLAETVLSTEFQGRAIVHFIQPHQPYIPEPSEIKKWDLRKNVLNQIDGPLNNSEDRFMDGFRNWFGPWLCRQIGSVNVWRIRNVLGMEPLGMFERYWRNRDMDKIKRLYRENLEIVLKSVSNLIDELDGDIVVTSDHGEAFGEKGYWGHEYGLKLSVLKEVPWFKVEGAKKTFESKEIGEDIPVPEHKINKKRKKEDKEKINQRLKQLGYK